MEKLTIAKSVLSFVGLAMRFWSRLGKVNTDLIFVWNQTLGVTVGNLIIENQTNRHLYLCGIRFKKPKRDGVTVRINEDGLRDTISNALYEAMSSENDVAVVNQRIEPSGKLEIELDGKEIDDGLDIAFEWAKHTPWTVRLFLMARRLEYSAADIEVMKRTVKRGE